MGRQQENNPDKIMNLDMPDRDNIRVTIRKGNVTTYLQVEYDVAYLDLNEDESRARFVIEGEIRIITERLESKFHDSESNQDRLDPILPAIMKLTGKTSAVKTLKNN
jgi:hypothetical protein